MSFTPYELGRIISRSNGVNSMKEYQLRDIKHRITRDFRKSIDAEDVTINGEDRLVLITRDKGDEQIKKIKSLPDERFDLGDIVNWNGTNYIIYKMDADRRIQSKGRMYECNLKLRWKNKNGEIIERVGKGEDATKYGEGTEGTFRLRIGEFQLKILIRLDEETVLIRRDDRFMIDADDFFGVMAENDVLPSVYKVSRRNVNTGTFPQDGTQHGYVEITLIEDQFIAGHDDIENRIAPRVSTIVKPEDDDGNDGNEGSSGNNDGNNNNDNTDEGGWL
jgi:hypothetical protein